MAEATVEMLWHVGMYFLWDFHHFLQLCVRWAGPLISTFCNSRCDVRRGKVEDGFCKKYPHCNTR